MRRKRNKSTKVIPASAAAAEDRISDLPDEILHEILCNLESPKHAARVCALSRRWRSVWGSYPVVAFDAKKSDLQPASSLADFQEFVEAEIGRFSRYNQIAIETLDVTIPPPDSEPFRSPALERLLNLAAERKAKYVAVEAMIRLPYRALSNPSAESLILTGIAFDPIDYFDFPPSLNALRTLCLESVVLHEWLFTSMIAFCPLLETLEMRYVYQLRKLKVSNATNLKDLFIANPGSVKEIEIEAPQLHTLEIFGGGSLIKLELIAPQLKHLELNDNELLPGCIIQAVISELQSLEYLSLRALPGIGKKLKLSSPKLEEFNLWAAHSDLEEFELDAGPCMSRFFLIYERNFPSDLRKCKINNAVACQWHADFAFNTSADKSESPRLIHLERMRRFFTRFPQFQTVDINVFNLNKVTFEEEEVDDLTNPRATVNLLAMYTDMSLKSDQEALLNAVFWICRPKFFKVIHTGPNSYRFFRTLLGLMSQFSSGKQSSNKHGTWQYQLKDVKITTRDADHIIKGEEEEEKEEEYLVDASQNMARLLSSKKRVCFHLSWL